MWKLTLNLLVATCFLILVLGVASAAIAQSVFPLKFDPEPLTSATNIESIRAVAITEARHYSKHFAYTVDSGALSKSVTVIEIDGMTDDTVVIVRVVAAMTKSDDLGNGTLRRTNIKGRYDADTNTWGCSSEGSGFGSGSVSCILAGTSNLQVQVLGATDELMHLVAVEVIASHEVTINEFATSL